MFARYWRINAFSPREVQSIPASLQGYNMNNRSLKDKVMSVTLALSSTSRAAQHFKKNPNNPKPTPLPHPRRSNP